MRKVLKVTLGINQASSGKHTKKEEGEELNSCPFKAELNSVGQKSFRRTQFSFFQEIPKMDSKIYRIEINISLKITINNWANTAS